MVHCFDVEIAKEYGILEAVLINHFVFWLQKNKANGMNFHDGDYWTYNSIAAFQEMFPYVSRRQLERALQHLRDADIIKVGNYNEFQYDRTLWYAFTKKGKCISRFGEMDSPKWGNGFPQMVEPIPDNNTDNNTDNKTDNSQKPKSHIDYDLFRSVYNETCKRLPSCRCMTEKRKKAVRAFFSEFGLDDWQEICSKAESSRFLTGDNDRGWKADIDFLLRPDKAARILEGAYQDLGARGVPKGASGELGQAELEAIQRVLNGG